MMIERYRERKETIDKTSNSL